MISKKHVYTINGESHTIEKWAEMKGLNTRTVIERLRSGKPIEDALYPSRNRPMEPMRITVDGITLTVREWAHRIGIAENPLRSRFRFCTPEAAVRMGLPRTPAEVTPNRLISIIRHEQEKLNGVFPAYRHYMMARKCSLGTFPGDGFMRFYNLTNHVYCEEAGGQVYAVLWYERPLTPEERANYEISKGHRVT